MRYKLIDRITFVLPAHWASALINGDFSGLEDEEQHELNEWYETQSACLRPGEHIECSDVSEESYFAHSCDADVLPGDVADYTFLVYEEIREKERGE